MRTRVAPWLTSSPTPTAPCAAAGTRWPAPPEVTGQPLGVVLLGEPWVLYRSGGEVRAFADRCIEIPALGAGATLPPAAHLEPAAGTAEAHGMVFVAPDEPIAPLGTIPEADDPSFMTGVLPTLRPRCPPTPWRATTGPSP